MPQHILVAHDLSAEADLALRRAALLARQHAARLTLLHVAATPEAETAAGEQLLQRLRDSGLTGAEVRTGHGDVVAALLHQTRGLQADLLVLGTHHRESAEGFAGTTLERVLHDSPAAVLLVAGIDPTPWQRALAALDFSPCASRALRQARALLGAGASLHALHISEVAAIHAGEDPAELTFEGELFDRLLAAEESRHDDGVQFSHELRQGERESCLQAVLAERRPQLLALGAHSRSQLADALLGSLTLEVLRQPPCDVLVVR